MRDDCRVTDFEFGASVHRLQVQSAGRTETVEGRWLIDASGRGGLIRHRLGLTRPVGHLANACWFRFPHRLRIDDWSADPRWTARVPSGERWLSTNHLMGAGYWVWLIPLGSGSTSVGIVVDATMHPYGRLNRFDRALDWLREFEPQCADVVKAHEADLEDFLALRGFAYGCSRVFSPDRWTLVGEAGLFTDPFYSPGSDFIAIGNDYTVDLIRRDCSGEDVAARTEQYNTTYLRLYDAFLRLYEGQYPIMGNAQVMTAKVGWDNACYWAMSAPLYFQRKYRDLAYMQQLDGLLTRFFFLHTRMQARLRQWNEADTPTGYGHAHVNYMDVPYLRTLQRGLADPLTDEQLTARLTTNLADLERFAQVLLQMAAGATLDRDAAGFEHVGALQLPKARVGLTRA
ncbi:MAG: halogenase [Acidobacteria bacterium]|nr:halogenase [Acidobacteriota bacterium]